ncbi:phospholipase D zeta 1-like protein, partial [Tanacetum coccineum]
MVMHPATLDFFRKVLTDIELMMVPMSEGIKYSELVSRYFSHTGEEYCDNYSYADVILKENKEAADAEKWKGALEEATGLAEDPFDTKLLDIILFDVLSPSNGDKGDQVLLAEEIYILIYKEVSIALKINSSYSQKRLLNIHKNVKVMHYPDHFAAGIYLWTTLKRSIFGYEESSSKKAGGDLKRKGKLEPYAYWQLYHKMVSIWHLSQLLLVYLATLK